MVSSAPALRQLCTYVARQRTMAPSKTRQPPERDFIAMRKRIGLRDIFWYKSTKSNGTDPESRADDSEKRQQDPSAISTENQQIKKSPLDVWGGELKSLMKRMGRRWRSVKDFTPIGSATTERGPGWPGSTEDKESIIIRDRYRTWGLPSFSEVGQSETNISSSPSLSKMDSTRSRSRWPLQVSTRQEPLQSPGPISPRSTAQKSMPEDHVATRQKREPIASPSQGVFPNKRTKSHSERTSRMSLMRDMRSPNGSTSSPEDSFPAPPRTASLKSYTSHRPLISPNSPTPSSAGRFSIKSSDSSRWGLSPDSLSSPSRKSSAPQNGILRQGGYPSISSWEESSSPESSASRKGSNTIASPRLKSPSSLASGSIRDLQASRRPSCIPRNRESPVSEATSSANNDGEESSANAKE